MAILIDHPPNRFPKYKTEPWQGSDPDNANVLDRGVVGDPNAWIEGDPEMGGSPEWVSHPAKENTFSDRRGKF